MRKTTKHVVMSKTVAHAYLERVGQVTSTLTVYFSDERQLTSFSARMQSAYPNRLASTRGFDYVTFLTQYREVASAVAEAAHKDGLTLTGF